jgi:hypothetical protein
MQLVELRLHLLIYKDILSLLLKILIHITILHQLEEAERAERAESRVKIASKKIFFFFLNFLFSEDQ